MRLEEQILTALTSGSPRTSAEDRVYPTLAPEKSALPRVVYTRVATTPTVSLSGDMALDKVLMQFDCWARTKAEAAELALEVRRLLAGQSFKAIPQGEQDGFEVESRLYRHTVEMVCWDKNL